jgi:hypothetical protein
MMEKKSKFRENYLDCGRLFRITIPATRAAVVHSLDRKNISQTEIAKKLMITQPAVNKYLKMSYSKEIKSLCDFILKNRLEEPAVRAAIAGKRVPAQIDRIAASKPVIDAAGKM